MSWRTSDKGYRTVARSGSCAIPQLFHQSDDRALSRLSKASECSWCPWILERSYFHILSSPKLAAVIETLRSVGRYKTEQANACVTHFEVNAHVQSTARACRRSHPVALDWIWHAWEDLFKSRKTALRGCSRACMASPSDFLLWASRNGIEHILVAPSVVDEGARGLLSTKEVAAGRSQNASERPCSV